MLASAQNGGFRRFWALRGSGDAPRGPHTSGGDRGHAFTVGSSSEPISDTPEIENWPDM